MPDTDDKFPLKPEQAREQEAEFFGVSAGVDYDIGGGEKWTLPNPSYMPRDMKKRYREHLRFMTHDLDVAGKVNPVTGRKAAVWPPAFKGELVDEDELLCVALMGGDAVKDREAFLADGTTPDIYTRFLAAGGLPGQVQTRWQMLNRQMQERLMQDPK